MSRDLLDKSFVCGFEPNSRDSSDNDWCVVGNESFIISVFWQQNTNKTFSFTSHSIIWVPLNISKYQNITIWLHIMVTYNTSTAADS